MTPCWSEGDVASKSPIRPEGMREHLPEAIATFLHRASGQLAFPSVMPSHVTSDQRGCRAPSLRFEDEVPSTTWPGACSFDLQRAIVTVATLRWVWEAQAPGTT